MDPLAAARDQPESIVLTDIAVERYTSEESSVAAPRRMFDHWSFSLPPLIIAPPAKPLFS